MKRFRGGLNEKWRKNGVVMYGIVFHQVVKLMGGMIGLNGIEWYGVVWGWYGMVWNGM